MVAVAAVLHLQLPVAVVGVGGVAAQDFQPVGRLVDDLVDDDFGLAQVVVQGLHVGVQATEQEALVALEARHLLQVVRAFLVELHRVLGGLFVLDLEQLASVVERPAVERAGEAALVAMLLAAQHGAAVGAGVDHRIEHAVFAARDDDGLTADGGGEVVVDCGDLALVGQVDPVAFEDVLHLEFKQRRVGKDVATAAVDAGVLVVLQGVVQQLFKVAVGVGYCGRVHGVRAPWGEVVPYDARRGSDLTEMKVGGLVTAAAACRRSKSFCRALRRPGGGDRRSGCRRPEPVR